MNTIQEYILEINSLKSDRIITNKQIAELQEELRIQIFNRDNLRIATSELQDKLHRRNLQIADLKKEALGLKDSFDQILHMSNIHGVYKDDTDCLNSIREAIYRNKLI